MLKQSVISRSGQSWKLVAAILALVFGSFAPLFSITGVSWTGGTIITIVGYIFGVLSIRCVTCGSRWFWQAAMDVDLYKPLFTRSACPVCRHEFAGD
jgi:hypothetical protein